MGIFSRRVNAPAFSAPQVAAAAGTSMIGDYFAYSGQLSQETVALSIPTVSRARDIHLALVGALELKHYTKQWTGERYEEIYLPLEPWMEQPDPTVTRQFFFGAIATDLFLHGRAFAAVTSRKADDNRPASFTWLPAGDVATIDQTPAVQYFGPSKELTFLGLPLNPNDVIQFISPVSGILYSGTRQLNMSVHLDQYADKLASLESVPGYLQQRGGETMSGDELGDLADAWAAARKSGNFVGALNDYVEFREFQRDPSEVVAEQRRYQALELARLCDVPSYMVSAPTEGSSMTYQNAIQARQDTYLFGTRIILDTIEQTLSMNNVLPRGRYVEFNVEELLGSEDVSPMTEPTLQEEPA